MAAGLESPALLDTGGNQPECVLWKRNKTCNAEDNSVKGLGRDRDCGPGRERGRSPLRQLRRPGLRVPNLDAVGIFILGYGVHGRDETHRPGLLLQAALQAFDMGQKPAGRQRGQVVLRQLGLGGLELVAQPLNEPGLALNVFWLPADREEGVRCVRTKVPLRQTGLTPRPDATRWNQMGD